MRKLLTTAAMILTMGVATPALADGYNGHGNQGNFGNHAPVKQQPPVFQHDSKFDRDVNTWQRGWTPFRIDVRFGQRSLNKWQIQSKLAAQGYYRVLSLQPAAFGNWRAVAMYRGQRVVLRVNQYTGRVIAARYI